MSAASSHVDTVRGVAGSAVRRVLGERVEKVGLYRRELLKGRAFWGNDASFWRQLCFRMANSHPVLSTCLAHPKHPLSRWERLMILIMTQVLQFAAAAYLSEAFGDAETRQPAAAGMAFVAGLVVSVFMSLLTTVLLLLVTADDRCCGSREGGACRCAMQCCSCGALWVTAALCVLLGAGVIVLVRAVGRLPVEAHAVVYVWSLAQSLTVTFVAMTSVFFALRWRREAADASAMQAVHEKTAAARAREEAEEDTEAGSPGRALSAPAAADVTSGSVSGDAGVEEGTGSGAAASEAEAEAAAAAGLVGRLGGIARSTASHVKARTAGAVTHARAATATVAARAAAVVCQNPAARRGKPVTTVTPAFPFSFGELQRWGAGEAIDGMDEPAAAPAAATLASVAPE